ncbi:MAG: hypothetical protein AB7P04_14570 [Bacteriovoracia bacterium]
MSRRKGLKSGWAVAVAACAWVCVGAWAPDSGAKPPAKPRLTSDRSERDADRREVLLVQGEDRVIDLDFDANVDPGGITSGNETVVKTTFVRISDGDRRQLIFKPLKPGETNVSVRDDKGNLRLIFHVQVAATHLTKTQAEIEALLRDVEGVKTRIMGTKIVIDGEVLVPADYARLSQILSDKTYGENVLNLVTLSPIALQYLADRIKKDVNAIAPNVTTRVVNGRIWLEGTVDRVDQAKRVERIAFQYIPEIRPGNALAADATAQRLPPQSLIQNFMVVNPPPQKKQEKLVRITVHFVELSKDYQDVFGFKWQPGFTADPQVTVGTTGTGSSGADSSTTASFTATLSSLFPKLQSAQNAGFARILKTGTLVIRNRESGVLRDETQIPFAVQGPNGEVATSTAGVGISFKITPAIVGQSEDISMDLELKQSNLVGKAGTAPITAQHEVTTKVYIKSNESAALAGVNSADVQTNFNKDDPAAGGFANPTTSPLFSLLRSKAYSKKKSQFVIFVTPQIIANASQGTKDLEKNFRVKVK